jgi:hypothetical protein
MNERRAAELGSTMHTIHTHTNGTDHQLKQMSISATQATIVNQVIRQLEPRN